jgi:chromosome segregation ATPase
MSFTSWGSNAGNVSSSGFEDWGSGSWRHKFPDHSGTKNPGSDPERIARIEHLENQIYNLADAVRNCDYKVDQAQERVRSLKEQLSSTKEKAYNARQRHLELGNKKAGLEGKQLGNKEQISNLRERLRYTTDTWAINDIKREIEQRENARWTIADEISNTTDAYRSATETMQQADNRIQELGYTLETATENVWNAKEECNMKKEKLSAYRSELSRLKSA